MRVEIPKSGIIACMCEGGAETVIMNMLIDNDQLIFNREQLIEESVLPRMSVKEFQSRHLKFEYDQKLTVLRTIDSRSEKFNLGKAYRCQVEVINVITAPEIEMLIIVSLNKYEDFCRSGIKKPSEYCKSILNIKNVKSPKYIEKHFSDINF